MPENRLLNQKEEEKKQTDHNTAYRTLHGIGVQPQGRAVSETANYQFFFRVRKDSAGVCFCNVRKTVGFICSTTQKRPIGLGTDRRIGLTEQVVLN